MARLVSVAVPVPQLDLLTYNVPDDIDVPTVGARVLVPVGSRLLTGCVVGLLPEAAATSADAPPVKDVADLLDDEAYLPDDCLRLVLWTAEYYACSPGEAVAAALPPLSTVESRRIVDITPDGEALAALEGVDGLDGVSREALRLVATARRIPFTTLGTRLTKALGRSTPVAVVSLLRRLERQGFVTTARVLEGERRAYKSERVVTLTAEGLAVAGRLTEPGAAAGLGPRQREVLGALRDAPAGLSTGDLRERHLPTEGLRRLELRGWLTVKRRAVDRDPFAGPWGQSVDEGGAALRVDLNDEQARALERCWQLRQAGAFSVALVHGVTGSGKTEVYLRLAERVVAGGQRVLILVPEIGLTPAVATAFRARFADRVAVQHSGLSDGERHDQWQRIRRGEIDVVVGTRSAVFAPLEHMGLIVVDEEHDASYKQDEAPRYNGRDLAIVRGKHAGALVVLGSATPSMESYQHATAGRYDLIELDQRVLARPLAQVQTVNMREEYAERGPDTIVSRLLLEHIGTRLERREQVLLLLNRRGLSTAVFCRQCGGSIECPNCSVSLVVDGRGVASCHYCDHTRRVPRTCPSCGAPYLELMGFGTERVEREVADVFPGARVARLDRDTTRRRGALPAILNDFRRGGIDVLVGTQMIAKGHDFPRVTLVGVISADVGLGLADFRAAERTFQLLTQVVGRAGRGDLAGEAVIQTIYPEHYSIRHACRQDYRAFYADEITFRQAMRYPPTIALVNGLVRGPSMASAMEAAGDLVARTVRLSARPGAFDVLGPATAPLARLRGEHRAQFFLKGRPSARIVMREALKAAIKERPDLIRRVAIDVDPLTVL
ncbi:MAG: primosomal protein N' [Vicinamibacterales bacterium]|nr:primosomal protein N' [Vicinamibacterales bacterium]